MKFVIPLLGLAMLASGTMMFSTTSASAKMIARCPQSYMFNPKTDIHQLIRCDFIHTKSGGCQKVCANYKP